MNPQNQPDKTGLSQSETNRINSDILAVRNSNLKSVYYGGLKFMVTFAGGSILSYQLFLHLPANLAHFAPGIASMTGIVIALAYIAIASRSPKITPEVITPDKRNTQGGFTLVEMLAVLAVMGVVCALSIPSGIFAKGTGEIHLARASAASLEIAKSNYQTRYGAAAANDWKSAYDHDPSVGNLYNLLGETGCLPAGWSKSYAGSKTEQSLKGYNVQMPPGIVGGITVVAADGQTIYPN